MHLFFWQGFPMMWYYAIDPRGTLLGTFLVKMLDFPNIQVVGEAPMIDDQDHRRAWRNQKTNTRAPQKAKSAAAPQAKKRTGKKSFNEDPDDRKKKVVYLESEQAMDNITKQRDTEVQARYQFFNRKNYLRTQRTTDIPLFNLLPIELLTKIIEYFPLWEKNRLCLVCKALCFAACQKILWEHTGLFATDLHSSTLLHLAAWKGNVAAVRFLLNRGLDVNAADVAGHTALHVACAIGAWDVANVLFDHGAADTLQDIAGFTPRAFEAVCGV